jgi:hypothetical protein
MAQDRNQGARPNDESGRDRYRDNDDVRAPLGANDRSGTKPDTRSEARGDAREAVGNTARDTDAEPRGAEENDKTQGRPVADEYDDDLGRERSG